MIIVPIYNVKFSFGVGSNPYKISKKDFEEVYIRHGMTALVSTKDFGNNIQVIVGMPSSNIEIFKRSLISLEQALIKNKTSKIKWFIEQSNIEYAKDFTSKHPDIQVEYVIRNNDRFNLYVYSLDEVTTDQFKEIDKMLSNKLSAKIFSCNFESNTSIKEYAYSREYEYMCLDIKEFITKGKTDRGVIFIGPKENYLELCRMCFEHKVPCRFIIKEKE